MQCLALPFLLGGNKGLKSWWHNSSIHPSLCFLGSRGAGGHDTVTLGWQEPHKAGGRDGSPLNSQMWVAAFHSSRKLQNEGEIRICELEPCPKALFSCNGFL